jgi:hypothetical protein
LRRPATAGLRDDIKSVIMTQNTHITNIDDIIRMVENAERYRVNSGSTVDLADRLSKMIEQKFEKYTIRPIIDKPTEPTRSRPA